MKIEEKDRKKRKTTDLKQRLIELIFNRGFVEK